MSNQETTASAVGEDSLNDEVVTMVEVLEQEKEMEEEYAAVMGGSDDKCCSYELGAVKRQALFSCLTCNPGARNDLSKCAGICLACAYRCHEHHDLVELYTKRNFRCDCPTLRFAPNCCLLKSSKDAAPQPLNDGNQYNHNFQGFYCICKRPYPDPELDGTEVMLQCVMCEDWYHVEHLGHPVPAAYEMGKICHEMICALCMERHEFMRDYTGDALKITDISLDDSTADTDLTKEQKEPNNVVEAKNEVDEVVDVEVTDEPALKKFKGADEEDNAAAVVQQEDKSNVCRRPIGKGCYENGAAFFRSNWRDTLCKCQKCMDMYIALKVEYLIDREDSIVEYQQRGLQRNASTMSNYERGMQALASMDRTTQIDCLSEYNNMKEQLVSFLQSFAIQNKVVTEADIRNFFKTMHQKPKAEVGVQNHCR